KDATRTSTNQCIRNGHIKLPNLFSPLPIRTPTTENTDTNGRHGLADLGFLWTVPSVLYACGAPPPHALARRLRASLGPQALCFRELRGGAFLRTRARETKLRYLYFAMASLSSFNAS